MKSILKPVVPFLLAALFLTCAPAPAFAQFSATPSPGLLPAIQGDGGGGSGRTVDADGDGLFELVVMPYDFDGDGSVVETCVGVGDPDPACKWIGQPVYRDTADDGFCGMHGCGFGQMEPDGEIVWDESISWIHWPCWDATIAASVGTATAACEFNDPKRHDTGDASSYDECHDEITDPSYLHCPVDPDGFRVFTVSTLGWQGAHRGQGRHLGKSDRGLNTEKPPGTTIYVDTGPKDLNGFGNSWYGRTGNLRAWSIGYHNNTTTTVHQLGASAAEGDSKGWWRIDADKDMRDEKNPYICIRNSGGTAGTDYKTADTAETIAAGDEMIVPVYAKENDLDPAYVVLRAKAAGDNQFDCPFAGSVPLAFASGMKVLDELALSVDNITAANPVRISFTAVHNLTDGDVLRMGDVAQDELDNRTFFVTRATGFDVLLTGENGSGRATCTGTCGSATALNSNADSGVYWGDFVQENDRVIHARSDYNNATAKFLNMRFEPLDPWNEVGGKCTQTGVWSDTNEQIGFDPSCDGKSLLGLWGGGRGVVDEVAIANWAAFAVDGGAHTGYTDLTRIDFIGGNGGSMMDGASGWRLHDIRDWFSQYSGSAITNFGPLLEVDGLTLIGPQMSNLAGFFPKHSYTSTWRNVEVLGGSWNNVFSVPCDADGLIIDDLRIDGSGGEHAASPRGSAIELICSSASEPTAGGSISNVTMRPPASGEPNLASFYYGSPVIGFNAAAGLKQGIQGWTFRNISTESAAPPTSRATITNMTAANPVVVTTSASHGFTNGQIVYLRNTIQEEVNGEAFTVAGATATTFQLSGENGTGRDSGASGGTAYVGLSRPGCLFGAYDNGTAQIDDGESEIFTQNGFFDSYVPDDGSDAFCLYHDRGGRQPQIAADADDASGAFAPVGCNVREGPNLVDYMACQ